MLLTLLSQEATESCTRHNEEESQKGILGSRTEISQLRRDGESPFEEGSRLILALGSSRTAISDEADGETWRDLSPEI